MTCGCFGRILLFMSLLIRITLGLLGSDDEIQQHSISKVAPNYSDRIEVKCKVCKRVIEEMFNKIRSIKPNLKYERKGYILEEKKAPIALGKSELFLVDFMDTFCENMADYARAYHKLTGRIDVIRLVIDGKMNPELERYEVITEDDGLKESLEYHCEAILSEHGDEALRLFRLGFHHSFIESKLCFETEICLKNKYPPSIFDEF